MLSPYSSDWGDIGRALETIRQKYGVTIAREELGEPPTIASIYRAAARHAGWAT